MHTHIDMHVHVPHPPHPHTHSSPVNRLVRLLKLILPVNIEGNTELVGCTRLLEGVLLLTAGDLTSNEKLVVLYSRIWGGSRTGCTTSTDTVCGCHDYALDN